MTVDVTGNFVGHVLDLVWSRSNKIYWKRQDIYILIKYVSG